MEANKNFAASAQSWRAQVSAGPDHGFDKFFVGRVVFLHVEMDEFLALGRVQV